MRFIILLSSGPIVIYGAWYMNYLKGYAVTMERAARKPFILLTRNERLERVRVKTATIRVHTTTYITRYPRPQVLRVSVNHPLCR